MKPMTPDDDWLFPDDEPPSAAVMLPPFEGVWRIEQQGEEGVPFPTLVSALAEPPTNMDAHILAHGVCLAEAHPERVRWMPTNAGRERIEREINGMVAA